LIAATGTMAQLLVVRAYRLASPARLAPFEYVQLPIAFVIGAVAFAEPVTAAAVLGTVQIVLATVLAARAPPTKAGKH
jgi:drug/metabolite transporter (DMT)-like permease